jgi:hypothetical protein
MTQFTTLKSHQGGWIKEQWDRWPQRTGTNFYGFAFWMKTYLAIEHDIRRFIWNAEGMIDPESQTINVLADTDLVATNGAIYSAPTIYDTFVYRADCAISGQHKIYSNGIPLLYKDHAFAFIVLPPSEFALSGIFFITQE